MWLHVSVSNWQTVKTETFQETELKYKNKLNLWKFQSFINLHKL